MKLNLGKLLLGCLLLFTACSKDGDYSSFLVNSEKVYPGRPDSVVVLSGYNRAQIVGKLGADPRVVKMRVYWNSKRNFVDAEVKPSDISKNKTVDIPTIIEGIHTFEIITFDAKGNNSVTSEKTGQVYGSSYVSGLVNRVFKSKATISGSPAVIWFSETNKDSPITGVEVTYPKIGGDSIKLFTPKLRDTSILVNAIPGGKLSIRTAYQPKNAIDVFYSPKSIIAY